MDFTLSDGVAVLSRTPGVLRNMLAGLPDALVTNDEGPGTWSPFDVVGHLIHGERADWIPRAKIILAQGENTTFDPFDRFAQEQDSLGKSLADLLDEFEDLRKGNLAALADLGLTDADLALEGGHPAFGKVTLEQLLATWVVHDLGHLAQISRTMAGNYDHAVGPWKEYLGILGRKT
jgi:hypothetical protein